VLVFPEVVEAAVVMEIGPLELMLVVLVVLAAVAAAALRLPQERVEVLTQVVAQEGLSEPEIRMHWETIRMCGGSNVNNSREIK
jgi:hypothetical protein